MKGSRPFNLPGSDWTIELIDKLEIHQTEEPVDLRKVA